MPKRRRERDRPKAAPDALYDPNKRVLLSYSSDEEAQSPGSDEPDALLDPTQASNTTRPISTPGENQSLARLANDVAQKDDPVEDTSEDVGATKIARPPPPIVNDDTLWNRPVRKNDTTGQWAALGSLSYQFEGGDEQEQYDSEEAEAMSYLQAVRSERQNMPTVFRAVNSFSHEEIYENGLGDTRGYYEDGAYVASANLGPHLPQAGRTNIEPQEAFTNALKIRFLKQRERLHTLQDLDSANSTIENYLTDFHKLLHTSAPLSIQIRALSQSTVFELFELIQKRYLIRGTDINTNLSTWIWALLARLDDVGSLNNDQVWRVRELGKRAILVQLSFADPAAAEQLARTAAEENEDAAIFDEYALGAAIDSSGEIHESLDISMTPTHIGSASPLKPLDNFTVRQNTLATLDAIIVLVGDVFRQRDLLEFRQPWTASTETA